MKKSKQQPKQPGKKLYKVTFGLMEKDDDCSNWRSVNVVAVNAWDAINKVRSEKNEYTAEVEIIANVDAE
jgi:hypothetical protein